MKQDLIVDGEAFTPGLRSKDGGLLGPAELPGLSSALWNRIWAWRDRYAVVQREYVGDGSDLPDELKSRVDHLDQEGLQLAEEIRSALGAGVELKYYSAVRLVYIPLPPVK